MRYLETEVTLGADEGEGAQRSVATLESKLIALEDRLRELHLSGNPEQRALVRLEISRHQLALARKSEAWNSARELLDEFLKAEQWELAADTCDILYRTEQEESLQALGHGIWLGVTFPIDPELTLTLLQNLVEDTPDNADGAAVAAAVGLYVVELRTEGTRRDSLLFFANQRLGQVARRHSQVESQEQFQHWIERLELHLPERLLVRLRNVVDVLVQGEWWFDREQMQLRLPVN